ncbi:MAG: helix-turn-helix domain-containing protein [Deltaproteobacteria bacterium]|nr:helix-turn-helix domain-containing protein [Deltaproteobacteria bacterium]NNK07282.1 helix-turn-helix domain-containing protein [Myxococcales bacterium]NNK42927.1 helix-turn-helix domain-containing protein [Myxococcales bacterium]RZV53320.1 MAG: helix-turn-helix domain-containing protein [Deltaproteobacteria bacterium]
MVARSRTPKDLFTASQIARFCQVDLKTIHNWADRGRIAHFRTPGRHLRFRRPHVLDFLRKYGYPIPEELDATRPRVALLLNEGALKERVVECLHGAFDIAHYAEPLDGLLRIGEHPPDAIVLAARVGHLSGPEVIEALKRGSHTEHVRAVLFADGERERQAALDAGASAHVGQSDLAGLRDTLEALMGVRH